MLHEIGCSIAEQQGIWVKPRQEFEILFKLVDDLKPAEKRNRPAVTERFQA
jgi:hypothetical protein